MANSIKNTNIQSSNHVAGCPCCGHTEPAKGSHPIWKVVLVATYMVVCVMSLGVACLGMFGFLSLPIWGFCWMAMITSAHKKAFVDPLCDNCGRYAPKSAFETVLKTAESGRTEGTMVLTRG